MNKIINGNKIKEKKLKEYKEIIKSINDKLTLAVIQVGNDPASDIYIKNKEKTCKEVGINFKHLKYESIKEEEIISKIKQLNIDESVTGILVQLPLPDSINKEKVINAIDPLKDVDGLSKTNIDKLNNNEDGLIPCTALGVIEILKHLNIDLKNKSVAVMGRSMLVGYPVSKLLEYEEANVNVCHSKTINTKDITQKADILIVAIGKSKLVDSSFVKDGAVVIDVGINRDNGKLTGDCDFDDIYDKCLYITPVPGGVGPLTITMLINNVIKAYKLQNK